MGLKGAPSYFQREIATRVLGGYLGIFCELYLDDFIIFGETEEEFAGNVEKILERLRVHNIHAIRKIDDLDTIALSTLAT